MSELDPRDWPVQEPPADFAERVVAAAREKTGSVPPRAQSVRGRFTRRAAAGVLLVGSMAAGVAFAVHLQSRGAAGDVTADARREVRVGTRAIAVLEAGAHVKWHGDDIEQTGGDVFWRVEPGARFTVHTAAADVTVKGTCFRVRVTGGEGDMTRRDAMVGAVGAVMGAAAFVGVYEGKVAVSHAGQSVDVAAGQGAQADGRGVHLTGLSPSAQEAASEEPDPLLAANANLADTVAEYRRRLEAIDADKKKLEKQLAEAEAKLGDAGVKTVPENKFDLTQDDWKDLAKRGEIHALMPCGPGPHHDYGFSPDSLNALGLAPQDGAIIQAALQRSEARTWAIIKPLCSQALAGANVDKLGEHSCMSVLQAFANQNSGDGEAEALRQTSEIQAGLRPMPGPTDDVSPYERALLAQTSESRNIEADLARQLGPDEARRIVYGDQGCWSVTVLRGGAREQQ
ncbi:MAG TPA: hypothetical protein VMI75_10250 [Polyangiaceae bacterium]|nr:hypothetical protein [Polyangiaceae bacterium]